MDHVDYYHKSLADGRWAQMSFSQQMGNIGSEISRAVKWKEKGNTKRMESAAFRALELFSLSIDACLSERPANMHARLKELCRGKEEFCDYIFADNSFHTDPQRMVRYYDQMALLRPRNINNPRFAAEKGSNNNR